MKTFKAVGESVLIKITKQVSNDNSETNELGLYVSKMKTEETIDTQWIGEIISIGKGINDEIKVGDTVKLFPLMQGSAAVVDTGTEGNFQYKILNVKIGDILAVIEGE
jgi:hypothetical protein